MAYLAAVLEQQHIVRIYDLALCTGEARQELLAALQRFAPDLLLLPLNGQTVMPERSVLAQRAGTAAPLVLLYSPEVAELADSLFREGLCDSLLAAGYEQSVAEMLRTLSNGQPLGSLLALSTSATGATPAWHTDSAYDLDSMAFPSRHLLQLEQYNLRAVNGQLQTTVLLGSPDSVVPGALRLRNPAHVVAELQSVARELGIRHFLLPDLPVTADAQWLRSFCEELAAAETRVFWEGSVQAGQISDEIVLLLQQSGCEALWFQFDLLTMLDSRDSRQGFCARVAAIKAAGIFTRTLFDLQPPYDRLPALIDMTATFGIEDVQFQANQFYPEQPVPVASSSATQLEQNAQRLYEDTVVKQRMIDRFGMHLGPVLWRLGLT